MSQTLHPVLCPACVSGADSVAPQCGHLNSTMSSVTAIGRIVHDKGEATDCHQ
jgi:hypothetical protein